VLCSESRINSQSYRSGYVNQQEWDKLTNVFHSLVGKKLHIDDTPILTVTQLKARAMRLASELMRQQRILKLIVVDYLQLMSGTTKRYESRQQEVTQISKDLKGVARELGLPLVVLSQLNRAPENRTDHRPNLSDLRESGAIEQDADVVAFVYRGDQYKGPNEDKDHMAEIIVAKHRNGPTGSVLLRFDNESARFDNLATNH
jgi:replicative DNA helicase